MISLETCREHLPRNLTDEQIIELRDLLEIFWKNMYEFYEKEETN